MNNELTVETLFPTCLSYINKPEYVNTAQHVIDDYVKQSQHQTSIDPLYPVIMTENMIHDERIKDLADYILNTAWNVLQFQGYDMQFFYTQFTELWGQEHRTGSGMDYHIHGLGSQISGFYFIEVPENSGTVIFHDPRPTKVYADLLQTDYSQSTYATSQINYKPRVGDLYFHNSWLPHSFSKNGGTTPFKFLHFNIAVVPKQFFDKQQVLQIKQPIVV